MWRERLSQLLLTVWVGSQWTIGYMVAPVLFATLADRVLAGTIAGQLFHLEAWVSVFAACVLLVLAWSEQRKLFMRLVLAMLACTLLGYFGLQPQMAALRAAAAATGGVMLGEVKAQFGMLHGISSAIYGVQSLLGVALILSARSRQAANTGDAKVA